MRHVYVHVPFCARRCVYCDFAIAVRHTVPGERYVGAVLQELAGRRSRGEWDADPLETLYLGGGTPSLLPDRSLNRLVRALLGEVRSTAPLEVTLEANPDDVTAGRARVWADAGVDRVSLGVQSFHPSVLAWMHRTHRAEQSGSAVRALRAAGVGAVSLDLIFGLPGHLEHDLRADLDRALALEPDHVSLYGLTVEPGTALARWVRAGAVAPAPDERYGAEFLLAHRVLTAAGFVHYEVSNFARPEHRARHNSAYWSGRRYGGLGPSAHSYTGAERTWNVAPWAAYERAVAAGDPTAGREDLTGEQRRLERVYLGLRTAEGAPLAELGPGAASVLRAAAARGWLTADTARVRLTPEGWLRLDELAGDLSGQQVPA